MGIIYVGTAVALGGLVFCFFWIKNASDGKNRGYAVFSMIGCITVLLGGLWYISSYYDILCYAPSKTILDAKIEIGDKNVEDSSVLILFNSIDYEMTPNDIERILGKDYSKYEHDGSVSITYRTQHYSLKGVEADRIVVEFNPRGKLHSVSWQKDSSDYAFYKELVDYLTPMLGYPSQSFEYNTHTSKWPGFYLENYKYRIYFERHFYQ